MSKGPTKAQLHKNEPSTFIAGGKKFDSLEAVGRAVEKNDISFNNEGQVSVKEKAWQPDVAVSTRKLSKTLFKTAAVLLGATLVASTGGIAGVVIGGLMGTMIAGGIGEGMRQAANAFDQAPQIKDQGTIQQGPNGLTYQSSNNDTQKPLVTLDEGPAIAAESYRTTLTPADPPGPDPSRVLAPAARPSRPAPPD